MGELYARSHGINVWYDGSMYEWRHCTGPHYKIQIHNPWPLLANGPPKCPNCYSIQYIYIYNWSLPEKHSTWVTWTWTLTQPSSVASERKRRMSWKVGLCSDDYRKVSSLMGYNNNNSNNDKILVMELESTDVSKQWKKL